MSKTTLALKWTAFGAAAAAGAYATAAGLAWYRYGRHTAVPPEESDLMLDRFMPVYEVSERHQIHVGAPADITFAAACDMDLMESPIIRAVFKTRQLVMGGQPADAPEQPHEILPLMQSIGWGVLALVPGREIVMGAVTQPWLANVVFKPLTSDQFAGFSEPDHVKIAWTLRADPIGDHDALFRTETRVTTTDADARAKFRRYWSLVSPGVLLIRRLSLGPVKADAERRARIAAAA